MLQHGYSATSVKAFSQWKGFHSSQKVITNVCKTLGNHHLDTEILDLNEELCEFYLLDTFLNLTHKLLPSFGNSLTYVSLYFDQNAEITICITCFHQPSISCIMVFMKHKQFH
jgi:hypothetical protein